MNGIRNSELNTTALNPAKLHQALTDNCYLVALLQRNLCELFRYDPKSVDYGDVTPNQYTRVMNAAVEELENRVFAALLEVEEDVRDKLGLPPTGEE